MLCFDKSTDQYFIASDEQVKIVENQMNDILKRMISEGKEIITLGEVMDAFGAEKNRNQNNDDQNHEQEGELSMTVEEYTKDREKRFANLDRDTKYEILDYFDDALRNIDHLRSSYEEQERKVNGDELPAIILRSILQGNQEGANGSWLAVYEIRKELHNLMFPDRKIED